MENFQNHVCEFLFFFFHPLTLHVRENEKIRRTLIRPDA